MSLAVRQLKVYAKLTLIVALTLVIAMVVYKNWDNRVTVWFFGTYESINVLWLMLCTAAAAIATWWMLSITRGVWRDMRESFKASEAKRKEEGLQARAEELAKMEQRIDKKLKGAIGEQDDHSG